MGVFHSSRFHSVGSRAVALVATHLPRLIALAWAAWAAPTAYAYKDGAPVQLQSADELVLLPLWILWAVAAALLAAGALVPIGAGPRQVEAARWMRIAGLAICACLLSVWGVSFLDAEAARGWVSAKNYIFMAFMALISAYLAGRDRVRVRGANV